MNGHTAATLGNADNAFARKRLTAFCTGKALTATQANDGPFGVDLGVIFGREVRVDRLDDFARRQFGTTQPRKQRIAVFKAQGPRRFFQRFVRCFLTHMFER